MEIILQILSFIGLLFIGTIILCVVAVLFLALVVWAVG